MVGGEILNKRAPYESNPSMSDMYVQQNILLNSAVRWSCWLITFENL